MKAEYKSTSINGHQISYREVGEGEPVLYVHGNPTSSFIWRDIMPQVSKQTQTRGIAIDLLGFGRSDKPQIPYTLELHESILTKFIETLGLKNVTLVLHDWGGPLGVKYACDHPFNVKRIALMETFLWNLTWADFPKEVKLPFKLMRSPIGYLMIQVMNGFINQFLPSQTLRPLSDEARRGYGEPFPTVQSRIGIRYFPKLIPVERLPLASAKFFDVIESEFLKLKVPKLWIIPRPGMGAPDDRLKEMTDRDPNISLVEFGAGKHYLQEDNPDRLAEILVDFIARENSEDMATAN